MNSNDLKDFRFREDSPVTIAAYYRLLLPSLLDDTIKRVLYLDCDVIVLKDVKDLFFLNLEGYGVAAVRDCTPGNDEHRRIMGLSFGQSAFCSGVMMINLEYWREHNCQKQLYEQSMKEREQVYFGDQDALNYVFRNAWFRLPYQFGHTPLTLGVVDFSQPFDDYYQNAYNPSIIHYAAHVKPWLDVKFPEREHYWHYVKLAGIEDPKVLKADKVLRKKIVRVRNKYLLNKYVRIFIFDVIRFLKLISMILQPKKFKMFALQYWLHKYGKK